MKILKINGKAPEELRVLFKCQRCGTEFEAEYKEYWHLPDNENAFASYCPNCKRQVCSEKIGKNARIDDYKVGDVCIYSFGEEDNDSYSIVEIVQFPDNTKDIAEIKFIKVIIDDSGNDYFKYLLENNKTMCASLKYLKNIMPAIKKENNL